MKKEYVVVTMGDPAGVGPEIVVKSLTKKSINDVANIVVVGNKGSIARACDLLALPVEVNCIEHLSEGNYEEGIINLINIDNLSQETFEYGKVSAECGKAAYDYIKKANDLCVSGEAAAMATTTINKESLQAAGIKTLGHTDILSELTGVNDPLTMFQVHELRTFFYSKHVSLRQACDMINKEGLKEFTHLMIEALEKMGVENPKIAVAGLNPHSGEHGLFGDEEVKDIIPAVEELQAEGVNVVGPIGADSVFYQALRGKYDGVLSLYHDQGHIATKTVDPDLTISFTHNLPYLRTSVDHGTAFDIAGKGIAREISLDEAIRLAAQYAASFRAHAVDQAKISEG